MGILKRQSIKASIVSYVGIVLGALNIVYFFPKLLSPDEIGFIETLRGIAFIIAPFAELGLPSIVNRFFPYYSDIDQKHKGFFSFIISIFIIGFLLISLAFYFFSDPISQAYSENAPLLANYIWYVLPLIFYIALFSILNAYSASLMRIVVPSILQNVALRLFTLLAILAYYFEIVDFVGFIFIFINVYAIPIVFMFIYLKFLKQLFTNFNLNLFNKKNFKTLGSYGIFVVFSAASGMLVNKIDVVMLSYLEDLTETGIYAIAFFIGSVIEIPRRSISTIALPILADSFKNNKIENVDELYKKTSINQLVVGILLFIGIWSNIDYIFQFIPNGEIYAAGKWVVFFIGLGKVIDMLMGCNNEIIIASKYYRFNLYSNVFLAILTIITNLIFIPIYGITGAALASALSILIFNLINYSYVKWKFNSQPFTINTIKGIIVGIVVFIIAQFIPDLDNKYLNILLTSAVISILYIGLIYILKISEDINHTIDQVIDVLLNNSNESK